MDSPHKGDSKFQNSKMDSPHKGDSNLKNRFYTTKPSSTGVKTRQHLHPKKGNMEFWSSYSNWHHTTFKKKKEVQQIKYDLSLLHLSKRHDWQNLMPTTSSDYLKLLSATLPCLGTYLVWMFLSPTGHWDHDYAIIFEDSKYLWLHQMPLLKPLWWCTTTLHMETGQDQYSQREEQKLLLHVQWNQENKVRYQWSTYIYHTSPIAKQDQWRKTSEQNLYLFVICLCLWFSDDWRGIMRRVLAIWH